MAAPDRSAFRPLDWFVIRAPLLPVDDYPGCASMQPGDPRVRRALTVGGGDIVRALDQPPSDRRARERLAGKLARYLIRMTTRPTPFGLFAGAGIGSWGEHTDAAIADTPPVLRTRPDMGWLLDVVAAVEGDPPIRPHLRWFVHPAAREHAGRVFLSTAGREVSVRASSAVRRVLDRARAPVPHHALVAEVMEVPGATAAKAGDLVDGLLDQALLISDLRPPLTVPSPARYVADRLAGLPTGAGGALDDLLEQLEAWDRLDPEEGAAAYPKLVETARQQRVEPATAATHPLQTDAGLPLAGRHVHRAVGVEAARAAELLLRMSPQPRGPSRLATYRAAFVERYGTDREVSLLDLLDPATGLGPPADATPAPVDDERSRLLVAVAVGAVKDGRRVIELDEATISRLERAPLATEHLPGSLELAVIVVAASVADIDTGAFQVVVGPNVGTAAAGRGLGRFADLIGPDAVAALRSAASAAAAAAPGRLWAEVSYLPSPGRAANVAVRPLVWDHEIVLDTASGAGTAIPVAELVVGIGADRFVLRWQRTGQEVVPCAGHMLHTLAAPPVIRFLDDITRDGRAVLTAFDWGPAAGFAFLPRVQVGRVVLAAAMWQLDPGDVDGFAAWRARWQPPRRVYLAVRDNRLLLDLDDPAHVEQIRIEARAGRRLVLHEALPGPDHAWLPGPDGSYLSDLVVPLVRTGVCVATAALPVPAVPASVRVRAPGSDWLYAKLHVLPAVEDEVLAGRVRTFCADVAPLVDSWFFIRYADPEPHLRIRWHGDPATLTGELAPRLLRWGGELVAEGRCVRFGIDTYDREVERYGGSAAMDVAEELFAADSEAVLGLLEQPVERLLLGMYAIDDLLAGLDLTGTEREELYRSRVLDRKATAPEFRERQAELRVVLGDPGWLSRQTGGDAVADLLARRRAVVRTVAGRLDGLVLGQPRLDLARSFVHMHANRLLGCGHPPEQRALGLLLRTRESLRRAPVRCDPAG